MRWLFIGVVALNLLYFGWRLVAAEDAPVPVGVQDSRPMPVKDFPSKLRLLSERVESVPAPPAVAPSPMLSRGCPAVGPFPSDADAARVTRALSGHGFETAVVGMDKSASPLFWVYLPALSSRQAASRKLRELQAKGIDSFMVADGPDANAISLGSFANRDSALGVQARMKASGYEVAIREQAKDIRQAWVILGNPRAQGFMEFVPGDLKGTTRVERQACASNR